MLIHALKLREHLVRNQINRLIWVDTRDMIADALNKGSISRDAVKTLMLQAVIRIVHKPMIVNAPTQGASRERVAAMFSDLQRRVSNLSEDQAILQHLQMWMAESKYRTVHGRK